MANLMRTLPFDVLLEWILTEYAETKTIFGIPESLFFLPEIEPTFAADLYGSRLTTPIGPAAGPHTQLAQNILAAWLCGGRFIELKTVQIMDELDIPRPCIDAADEGYNVEWSQELKLTESADEYVKAWALVHVLRRLLGLDRHVPFGTIFNMSVGYNLEGILSEPMQRFMQTLENATEALGPIRQALGRDSRFSDLEIADRTTTSVTLSTMHGCPPDEIEKIARYLLEERGLHTTVKLNPTLLGKETVLSILHDRLGYTEIDIPDAVFEHDLQYEQALSLISALKTSAAERNLAFAVKLSNTLAMANHRGVLPGDEMYMSGRALFPVTVTLFDRLADTFDGDLRVSYSAGADALNVADLLAAGAFPVTVASDLLKPGGYGRLCQYIDEIGAAMTRTGSEGLRDLSAARRDALHHLAAAALTDERYTKAFASPDLPKTETPLMPFDCVEAPCIAQCAVCQDVPDYVRALAEEDPNRALGIILSRNPLPGVTGHVCTNLCQTRCTRRDYDQPVAIRKLKRFAAEHGSIELRASEKTGHRVAVIGSGPSGLAAAYFLSLSGIEVMIYEARDRAGGMLALAPTFRLPREIVNADIERITDLGATIELGTPIESPPEELLDRGYDAVYVACGYAKDARLPIEGGDAEGVTGAIDFLLRAADGQPLELGDHVVVVGGGNTAMDAARTAQRLTGRPTTVLYRRTRAEMPAETEEIEDLLEEGNDLVELVSPIRVETAGGRVCSVACVRNRLGEPGADGRRRPEAIEGSELSIEATAVLLATGQRSDLGFLDGSGVHRSNGGIVVDGATGRAADRPIYAGGDVARGPEIIIAACADGRRAAEAICAHLDTPFRTVPWKPDSLSESELADLKATRARKSPQTPSTSLPIADRGGFDLVEGTFNASAARTEAERCLQCEHLCDKCVEVCPNRANVSITVRPLEADAPVYAFRDGAASQVGSERVRVAQPRQIVHVEDFCNACGNCTTFCVHPGEPFRAKPRLYLFEEDYRTDDEQAFLLRSDRLCRTENGQEVVLRLTEDGYRFDAGSLRVDLARDGSVRKAAADAPFEGTVSVGAAIEMIVLFEGIRASAPHLVSASESLSEESA